MSSSLTAPAIWSCVKGEFFLRSFFCFLSDRCRRARIKKNSLLLPCLHCKNLVQGDFRDRGPHDVKHVRRQLLAKVGKLVKGVVRVFGIVLVLDRHDDQQEDVVAALGLDAHVELLDPEVEASRDALADAAPDGWGGGLGGWMLSR